MLVVFQALQAACRLANVGPALVGLTPDCSHPFGDGSPMSGGISPLRFRMDDWPGAKGFKSGLLVEDQDRLAGQNEGRSKPGFSTKSGVLQTGLFRK